MLTSLHVPPSSTKTLADDALGAAGVRAFQLIVEEGPAAETEWRSTAAGCSIGSHRSNDLTIDDPTVSRFHCEIRVDADGARVRDLESTNGTTVDGVRVADAWLRTDSRIRMGRSVVRFQFGTDVHRLPLSDEERFGGLVGVSTGMRAAFGLLERAAASQATVLIEGETGTGKEGAARGLHDRSSRADGPFVVVDCGAIPANLVESELFGHERGAFTGATDARVGAFEEADGGTIFLDEIGELPLDLQPKLLRVLERGEIRRIGSNNHHSIDARVIAATHRDLRADVNAGSFRPDLYFRLAVIRVPLPPLRERPEDIPGLVEHISATLTDDETLRSPLLEAGFLATLRRGAWPGNVRELRNYLERCIVLGGPVPLAEPLARAGGSDIDASVPYAEARQSALDQFERRYIEDLLRRHDNRVAAAARAAGMNRAYLYRLLQRHGLRGGSS
jgi:DNA-binding NtrC family response regulator